MSGDGLRANPYIGLRPFRDDDVLYFYGRDQQTAELLAILREHRFLAVVGSSGSGKSSLVRAGLLPSLLGGFLVQDRDRWRTVQIKPGDAPIGNLAAGLVEAMGRPAGEAAELERDIRENHTDAVVTFLTTHLGDRSNLFLLVDQFEEIFAFRGRDEEADPNATDLKRRKKRIRRRAEAADFVDLLLGLAERRELPIYVSLTMRTDFLGECDLFYGLPEALNRGRYLVPRLTREQLRDAIECPVLLLNAEMAAPLLDHVLNELGARGDRLPVLQHALLRTWDAWDKAGRIGPIGLADYHAAGGIDGALNQDAEGALKGLDVAVTARIFKRLTNTDAGLRSVRSPARISELMAASGADRATVSAIVERFARDGRSFVHLSDDGQPGDPRVDISHESLIRQWQSLKTWVEEERVSRDHYQDLLKATKRARGAAALLQDPDLKIAFDWREREHPSSGWAQRYSNADGDFASATDYLDESVRARSIELAETELSRRWRRVGPPVAMLLVAALLGAGFYLEWHERLSSWAMGRFGVDQVSVAEGTVGIRGLTWTTDDHRATMTWDQADRYCQALKIPTQAGGPAFDHWRLPTQSELLDLYAPTEGSDFLGRKLLPAFQPGVNADYLWSSDAADPSSSTSDRIAADFSRQQLVPLPRDTAQAASALCVNAAAVFSVGQPTTGREAQLAKRAKATAEAQRKRDLVVGLAGTLILALLLTVYYLLATGGRWLQRKLIFNHVVHRFMAFGGRRQVEVPIDAGQRVDAVTAHATAYASTVRRVFGWGIDVAVFLPVVVAMLVAILQGDPRVSVTQADGTPIAGAFQYWDDKALKLTLTTDDGRTLTLDTEAPPQPEFLGWSGGDAVKTTLPSGASVNATSFLTRVVKVAETDDNQAKTGVEWYGTVDGTQARDGKMLLNYTLDHWQATRDAWAQDLAWQLGPDQAKVRQQLDKWIADNPPPGKAGGQREFPSRGAVVDEFVEPPSDAAAIVVIMASLILAWLYEVLQIASTRQATIGMRLAGVMRTDLHGGRLTFARASALYVYRLGSYLTFGLGFLVQPVTKKKQTLHDRLAGSVVLRQLKPDAPRVVAPVTRKAGMLNRRFAAVCVLLLMSVVVFVGVWDAERLESVGAPGEEPTTWTDPWSDLGILLTVGELSLNGQRLSAPSPFTTLEEMQPSLVVAPGAPIAALLKATVAITPPARCHAASGCPVGFAIGYDSVSEFISTTSHWSGCDLPALFVSDPQAGKPFPVEASLSAPTEPGRYLVWFDFIKLGSCGEGGLPPEGSLSRLDMTMIEVK